ncbi:hypothetical protein [Patulibacter sp. SYSU D01012]|uniref:hypothetical protein n=1 Tax=Patulibacter sp. SYSU D01012 TaxID=2817381 RepID=UPI001B3102F0|nr:hypothetical protein [Patulibacter sp. SYSU D01012]
MGAGDHRHVGAYGLRLHGMGEGAATLAPARAAWPALAVQRSPADRPAPERLMAADRAIVTYRGGAWAALDRVERRAVFRTPTALGDAELLHPYLSAVAATFARWDGREALHGGAVVGAGGAWALLAGRGGGKSTAAAALAVAGRPVVADDLVVVDGADACAGPAFVDLRPDAADVLAASGDAGVRAVATATDVRAGTRRRVRTPLAPPAVPLRGLVFLAWGDVRRTVRLGPTERLARLAPCRASGREDVHPDRALALARLPAWLVERPRDAALHETVETLEGLLDGPPA